METEMRKNALMNGLILGIISIVIQITMMYIMSGVSSMMGIVGAPIISLIIGIAASVYFSIDLRKKIGGFWAFKQAVTGIFIMLMTSYLLAMIVTMIFTKVVEPGIQARMAENVTGVTATMMENQGMDQAKIDQQIEDQKAKMAEGNSLAPGQLAKGLGIAILINFIFALILAAILKKEQPLFATDDEVEVQ